MQLANTFGLIDLSVQCSPLDSRLEPGLFGGQYVGRMKSGVLAFSNEPNVPVHCFAEKNEVSHSL